MCNCEEMAYEDYETTLNVLSELSKLSTPEQQVEAPAQAPVPVIQVSTKKK